MSEIIKSALISASLQNDGATPPDHKTKLQLRLKHLRTKWNFPEVGERLEDQAGYHFIESPHK